MRVVALSDSDCVVAQNILLSLDSVPLDKADATLEPEAGSCNDCPKRTGFDALLFGEMSKRNQCADAACFHSKLGRFMERQIEAKPTLVQIATSNGARPEGAVLPRNRYVALQLTNPAKSKQPLSPCQKPCKHMAEAIVVEREKPTADCPW